MYLDSVDAIPARGGKANISAIAEACGFDRQVLYKNPTAKKLVEECIAAKGLKGIEPQDEPEDAQRLVLERKITSLEQRNAALAAENYELRRKLKQYDAVEALMCQGKRVIP